MEPKSTLSLYTELLVLGAIWGASFLFLRIASPEFGPLALIGIRSAVAAVVLLPLVIVSGEWRRIFQYWGQFLWLGAVTVAIPFTLFAYTTLHISAGGTSLLNSTVPIFSALIAWLWLKDPLSYRAIGGLFLGFVGVFVLSFGNGGSAPLAFWPVIAALTAACLYGYGSCYAKLKLEAFSSILISAGSQFGSTILLIPFAVYFWPNVMPSFISWVSVLLLGIFCTAIALIMYFRLIKQAGVAKTVSVTYLIPVFGIVWGAIFLKEGVTVSMLGGGALVLMGVALTTSPKTVSTKTPAEQA